MTQQRTEPAPRTALQLIERAEQAVDDLCSGRLRWEMRVPAEPDHDPDLIISSALREARRAIEAEAAEQSVPDMEALAQESDDFKRGYVDGYTFGFHTAEREAKRVAEQSVPLDVATLIGSWNQHFFVKGEEHYCQPTCLRSILDIYDARLLPSEPSEPAQPADAARATPSDALREALERLIEAAGWCGGSEDFAPDGKAGEGWRRVVLPAIKQASAALAASQPTAGEEER